jgi:hypothetical protein
LGILGFNFWGFELEVLGFLFYVLRLGVDFKVSFCSVEVWAF